MERPDDEQLLQAGGADALRADDQPGHEKGPEEAPAEEAVKPETIEEVVAVKEEQLAEKVVEQEAEAAVEPVVTAVVEKVAEPVKVTAVEESVTEKAAVPVVETVAASPPEAPKPEITDDKVNKTTTNDSDENVGSGAPSLSGYASDQDDSDSDEEEDMHSSEMQSESNDSDSDSDGKSDKVPHDKPSHGGEIDADQSDECVYNHMSMPLMESTGDCVPETAVLYEGVGTVPADNVQSEGPELAAASGNEDSVKFSKPTKAETKSKKESKKKSSKAVHGTSENPLDITDMAVDSGSLLQLYQNDYFDAYMHMHHLYHRKESGVHEYLVNLLYSKRTNEEVMFYLPQLCQLSIAKYGKSSLHRFLLDKASTSMHFALKLSWFYQAIIYDKASKLGNLAQKMTQETEMAVVNCKLITPTASSKAPVEDRELNVCSKGLLLRRNIIKGIRERNADPLEKTTEMHLLSSPKFSNQLRYNISVLKCPQSKVKLPSPYIKIGNPLDLEIQPHVDCPDEMMRYELERLMMKQRRLDYFNTLSNFVKLTMDISRLLTTEPKREAREPLLLAYAKAVNEWMLLQRCAVAAYEETFAYRGLSLPMRNMGRDKVTNIPFQFLRIVEDEIRIFFSKKRAPFVFYFEIANLDEDVKGISEKSGGEGSPQCSFSDLYVFDAIVKDLISSGLLEQSEVDRIRNPLECIRHALGMLPDDVVERFHRETLKFQSSMSSSCNEPDDPDSISVESSMKDLSLGSKEENGEVSEAESDQSKSAPGTENKLPNLDKMTTEEAYAVAFPELLEAKKERLRKLSPYGNLKSWNLRGAILKGGDDLRQEFMVNQLLRLFRDIFAAAQLPLWLKPMEILVTGPNCGIIEFLPDSCSVDVIKRRFNVESISKVFERIYANNIFEARKNFIESHAAYSIISYLLQVKDRHNGNMMLDSVGHIVHIDYGFCLSNTPGNINFETSPFKLTREYLDIIGGETSDNFEYFRTLVIRGLLEARKHMDRIVLLVDMMTDSNKMPCFAAGTAYTMEMFKERFMLNLSEEVCIDRIVAMIEESVNNFRTVQYDNFQRLTNGIK
ncbi:phosphatidylinositol kinase [Babesia gibsoni]|uniref:1-phosphatidylinositol 4-kinase n=1 Tax=Babesia gibsoni TaxID=33632 RepID=A0AAD8LRV2_BABGI|nr:phosphatidylinositol kinase [Babesia gibsoni]